MHWLCFRPEGTKAPSPFGEPVLIKEHRDFRVVVAATELDAVRIYKQRCSVLDLDYGVVVEVQPLRKGPWFEAKYGPDGQTTEVVKL